MLTFFDCREGGVGRGHGFRSLRLSASQRHFHWCTDACPLRGQRWWAYGVAVGWDVMVSVPHGHGHASFSSMPATSTTTPFTSPSLALLLLVQSTLSLFPEAFVQLKS